MTEILAGAEPSFVAGSPTGILCLHGFGGTPFTVRPVADSLASHGYTVSVPRLPGHGTTAADMATTDWSNWQTEVERAWDELGERCATRIIVGLSMGATLALSLATARSDIDGIVVINPLITVDPDMVEQVQMFVDAGALETDAGPSDISDPTATELGYETLPLQPMLSLYAGAATTLANLSTITAPTLVITSRQDHVVPAESSQLVVEALGSLARQVWLEKSFHVATLDVEQQLLSNTIVDFIANL